MCIHTYPLEFLLNMTWHKTVVCYKVIYLPEGIMQNLVLAKLPNSGFWRYGKFLK